jgi:putative salt-induced outer membrane protein YdiY
LFDYIGSINQSEGTETANSQRVTGQYDVFKTRKFFWRPVFGEYFRDPFQNIAHRITLGAGLGYHLIDTSKTTWDVTAGAAFQYSQNESVEAGQASDGRTPALVAGTIYETEITKNIDFNGSYSFQIVDEEAGTFTHHAVATLETEMTKKLDFDITFVWDRIQNPRPASDGAVPLQNDYRLIFGLGYDF